MADIHLFFEDFFLHNYRPIILRDKVSFVHPCRPNGMVKGSIVLDSIFTIVSRHYLPIYARRTVVSQGGVDGDPGEVPPERPGHQPTVVELRLERLIPHGVWWSVT